MVPPWYNSILHESCIMIGTIPTTKKMPTMIIKFPTTTVLWVPIESLVMKYFQETRRFNRLPKTLPKMLPKSLPKGA